MIVVITGGSGSGKSAYAESYITRLREKNDRCFYIATMHPYGEEGKKRVEKHRKQRAGKGFVTIECYQDIGSCIDQVTDGIVLLECMSNFVANKMFGDETNRVETNIEDGKIMTDEHLKMEMQKKNDFLEASIVNQIKQLANACKHLVIVTNEVFCDGMEYEKETIDYMRLLGKVNQVMFQMADEAVEVVYSIPVFLRRA